MNNTTILKLLGLLEQDNKQEIKEILTHEMLQSTDKKIAKIYNLAKKYITAKENTRENCRKIQNKNGKQFLCDGYSLHIFNNHQDELDTLPQALDEESVNYPAIYNRNNYTFNDQDEEDKFIFANIKKYINYIKAQPTYNKKDRINVEYHGLLFDAQILDFTISLHQKDIDTVQVAYNTQHNPLLALKGTNIDSLIMPLHIYDVSIVDQHSKIMKEFKNQLEGVN